MSRQEKIAWFNLAIFGLTFAVFLFMYYIYGTRFDDSTRLIHSIRSLALLILIALGPVLFMEKNKESESSEDTKSGRSLQQKLIAIGGIVILYLVLRKGIGFLKGVDYVRDNPAYIMIFIFLCILALGAVMFNRYKKSQENSYIDNKEQTALNVFFYGPHVDERDLILLKSALRYGLGAFWIYYAIMFVWAILLALHQGYRTISIDVVYLFIFFIMGINILVFAGSIAVIITYRRENMLSIHQINS